MMISPTMYRENNEYPDDVLVYLIKDGLEVEGCWTRIVSVEENFLVGKLVNEPKQDFGYHEGDLIGFYCEQTSDEQIIYISDMNPSKKLTEKDLEDGTLLKNAIITFNKERTEEHLIDIFELVRDSYVWIPCNAILGEKDYQKILANVEANRDHLDALKDEIFTTEENIRLVPDILVNGDDFFFPVFTSVEEMGEYGKHFSTVERHFLDAIQLARNNEKNVKGIVINAFSEPFVITKEIFEVIEKAKSRL